MSARAPRDPRSLSPLLRHTDRTRQLIRRWGTVLAGLALVVAPAVGVVAARLGPGPADGIRVTQLERSPVGSAQLEPARLEPAQLERSPLEPARVDRLRAEAGSVAAAVDARTDVTGIRAVDPVRTGVVAAVATLLGCWTLLAAACFAWRRRLAARDRGAWTAGWARVEPGWSGRTV